MENVKINELLNLVVEDTSREMCIEKMPYLLAKRALFERIKEQAKIIKQEIELATRIIGPYINEYFEIKEKVSKTNNVRVANLDKVMQELENGKISMNSEQKVLFNQLKDQIAEDKEKALISKKADKLKILKQINETKANEIIEVEEKRVLELKESKNLLKEIERQQQEKEIDTDMIA